MTQPTTEIAKHLEENGQSQAWLARKLGLRRQTIGGWVRAEEPCPRARGAQIALLLGRRPSELFDPITGEARAVLRGGSMPQLRETIAARDLIGGQTMIEHRRMGPETLEFERRVRRTYGDGRLIYVEFEDPSYEGEANTYLPESEIDVVA